VRRRFPAFIFPLFAASLGAVEFEPLLREYCIDCHDPESARGGFDMTRHLADGGPDPIGDHRLWMRVAQRVADGSMPPEDEVAPPRAEAEAWASAVIGRIRDHARAHDGEVGEIPPRRLSLAEYGALLEDATGTDWSGELADWPVDIASGAGFRNHGLRMTPEHFERCLAIADRVSRQAILFEDRIGCAPVPVVDPNKREAWLEERIGRWRERYTDEHGRIPLTAHLLAVLGVVELPDEFSGVYQQRLEKWLRGGRRDMLTHWVRHLLGRAARRGPEHLRTAVSEIQKLGSALAVDATPDAIRDVGESWWREGARRHTRTSPQQLRRSLTVRFVIGDDRRRVPMFHEGVLHLPFSRDFGCRGKVIGDSRATMRLAAPRLLPPDGSDAEPVALREVLDRAPDGGRWDGDDLLAGCVDGIAIDPGPCAERYPGWTLESEVRLERARPPTLVQLHNGRRDALFPLLPLLTSADDEGYRAARATTDRFVATFPPQVVGPMKVKVGLDFGTPLHPYYRRDDYLYYDLMLDEDEQRTLDRLWNDLWFASRATEHDLRWAYQWASKHNHLVDWSQSHLLDEEVFAQYLGVVEGLPEDRDDWPDEDAYWLLLSPERIAQRRERLIEWNRRRAEAESRLPELLVGLAARWWSHPADGEVATRVESFFEGVRAEQGAETAMRETVVYLLTAPEFLMLLPRPPSSGGSTDSARDWDLARRLALKLAGAFPDAELRADAADGSLRDPERLGAHVRRLVRAGEADFLIEQAFGHWLGWADLRRRPTFDPNTWPDVDDALLADMQASCRRTVRTAILLDRPVADLLFPDRVWLTPALARHAGVAVPEDVPEDGWFEHPTDHGLLTAPGLLAPLTTGTRASVVRRGAWVYHRLLGRHLGEPPGDVGVLPVHDREEAQGIRDVIARHLDRESCRACHGRFDGFGFAFERWDGTGRLRTVREIDVHVDLDDGTSFDGIAGLRTYLHVHRRELVEQTVRKLLGYALGRKLALSDEPFVARTVEALGEDGRWSDLLVAVFTAPQWTRLPGRKR